MYDKAGNNYRWFLSEYDAKVKERKQINENKEYQEYLKLKEKYENKTDI